MKKVTIKKLSISYFKGIKSAEYVFSDGINIVSGKNGIGKSSIADAIFWCLFDVNMQGTQKFGIKTRDNNGEELHNVEHSVNLLLVNGDEEIELKRTLKDTVSEDGAVSNRYGYYIDGDVSTVKEYNEAINKICDVDKFRCVMNPLIFANLDWKIQRAILSEMVNQPTFKDIAKGEDRFRWLESRLEQKSAEEIAKNVAYKRKEVQKYLDAIPVRIEELTKVMPQKDNWNEYEARLEKLKEEEKTLEGKILSIQSEGGVEDIMKQQMRSQLELSYKRKQQMERGAYEMEQSLRSDYLQSISQQEATVREKEDTLKELEQKCKSVAMLIERCDERAKELEKQKMDGSKKWKDLSEERFTWDVNDNYCPQCGQMMPIDKIEKLKAEAEERFNQRQAKKKADLLSEALKVKNGISQVVEERNHYTEERKVAEEQKGRAEKSLQEEYKRLADMKQNKPKKVEAILAEHYPTYAGTVSQIKKLESDMDSKPVAEKKDIQNEISIEIVKNRHEQSELAKMLVAKDIYTKIQGQISGVEAERITLQKQLDELDNLYDSAKEYGKRLCEYLERTVNRLFGKVEWTMFSRKLDGTPIPYCECKLNGVPYKDLNTANKINAGLDICHGICTEMGIDIPCIIDNAESVLDIDNYGSQQIRLTVTNNDTLTISHAV